MYRLWRSIPGTAPEPKPKCRRRFRRLASMAVGSGPELAGLIRACTDCPNLEVCLVAFGTGLDWAG